MKKALDYGNRFGKQSNVMILKLKDAGNDATLEGEAGGHLNSVHRSLEVTNIRKAARDRPCVS